MERQVFKFKAKVSAHGLERITRVIVIADNRADAVKGAKQSLKRMCSELCEHATYVIITSKEMNVDAIVAVQDKIEVGVSNN